MSELVSLIMPAYRVDSSYFRAAVASALAQDNVALELVIVDDGSPEPVAPLLSDFDDARIRLFRIQHGGVSRARNVGIAKARGKWIRFIDGDDIVPADSTRLLLDATSPTHRITYGDTLFCNERLEPLRLRSGRFDGHAHIPFLVGRLWLQIPAVLFHRDVVAQAGPFNEKLVLMEDDEFILRALGLSLVRSVRKTVYLYRRHEDSTTRRTTLNPERVWKEITRPHFHHYAEPVRQRLEREARATAILERAYKCARTGAIKPTMTLWLGAALHDPLAATRRIPAISRALASDWLHRTKR